jgi:chromosome segregation ATPase
LRITDQQRRATEQRIRAAMDRLLRGDIPPASGCDIKTLAREAGVARNSLYTTYTHLKDEFDARRARLNDVGDTPDSRQARITRLSEQVAALKQRIADRDATIADLTAFRTAAVSRLAAQHDEILRLRQQIASHANVRTLHPVLSHNTPAG